MMLWRAGSVSATCLRRDEQYGVSMSLNQILEELPNLSPQERLRVAEQALALDGLSAEDEALVEQRLADHDHAPGTAIELDDFLAQLRARHAL
jgi:hypothetical protein